MQAAGLTGLLKTYRPVGCAGVNIKVTGDTHEVDDEDEAMAPCDFESNSSDPDGGMLRDDTLKQTVKFKNGVVEGALHGPVSLALHTS